MTALQWITKEAKSIRRKYPKRFATWREYVAQASAIYAKKHKGKSTVGKKRKKVSGIKLLEKGEKRSAKPAHVYEVQRDKKGHFKKYKKIAGATRKKTTGGIATKSKSHTDYNRNKVSISVGAAKRKRKTIAKKATARRRRMGGVGSSNLLPVIALGGLALAAYAIFHKQQQVPQYPVQYQPTGDVYRDQTASKIISYATAAGLAIDSITKLIQSLNTSSTSDLQAISTSIDSGQGIPTYYV